jgi:guanine nucleotide-binding protein subunit alpha
VAKEVYCKIGSDDKSFLDNIKRIAHPQYTPNSEDIFHAHALGFQDGVLETRIRLQKVNIRLVDIAGIQHNVRKYAHCLEGAAAIVFFYDLTSYDFMSEMAAFRETLDLFHLVLTNSDSLIRSSVILYLTNVAEFKEKLPLTPLGNIFPSYRDGADADEAMDYISGLFIQHPSCRDRGVHVRSLEDDDPQTLGLLEAAIANCVVRTAIEGFSDSSGNGPAK